MKKQLEIAPDLALPLDAATQTFAFIARKGAGKTYAAGKLVELLLAAGVQVVILDTVGNWYGLRLAADGKGAGFDIAVLGGLRGDLPLQATAGELIADVVVETGRPMILDISQFSLADRKRFATAFGERLWKNKKAEAHPTPLMLVLEESQLIVPQFSKGSERMLGIYEEIIRLGRNYGIGAIMISQRPQSVNKEVLNQTECLFVLQINGAQERKALKEWIVYQGMDPALLNELPSLPVGTAYVWSPQWLGILQKVKIAPKRTFDSSATPRVGVNVERREIAPLDLDDLELRMAESIEQAKANDPDALRAEIFALQTQVRRLEKEAQHREVLVPPTVKEVFVFRDGEIDQLKIARAAEQALAQRYQEVMRGCDDAAKQLAALADEFSKSLGARMALVETMDALLAHASLLQEAPAIVRTPAPVLPAKASSIAGAVRVPQAEAAKYAGLSAGATRILNILAQYPKGRSKVQVAVMAGYSHRGGGFNNLLGALRTQGFIKGKDFLHITNEGFAVLGGQVTPLPRGQALVDHWLAHPALGKASRAILKTLWDEYPNALEKETLARAAGYEANGGGFNNALGTLRTLELITKSSPFQVNVEVFG